MTIVFLSNGETETFTLKATRQSKNEESIVTMKGMEFKSGDIVSAAVTETPISKDTPRGIAEDHTLLSIAVQLSEAAGTRMKLWTEQHKDKRIAIVLDKQVITAPVIRSGFGSEFMITGEFSREEAEQIAKRLSAPTKQ